MSGFKLIEHFGRLPGGAWDAAPNAAIALPLARPGEDFRGVFIAGVSPYRVLDDDYRGFFERVAGQVTTAIAQTLTDEDKHKRVAALGDRDRARTRFLNSVSHAFRTGLGKLQVKENRNDLLP